MIFLKAAMAVTEEFLKTTSPYYYWTFESRRKLREEICEKFSFPVTFGNSLAFGGSFIVADPKLHVSALAPAFIKFRLKLRIQLVHVNIYFLF
jgi:hypothetical protein